MSLHGVLQGKLYIFMHKYYTIPDGRTTTGKRERKKPHRRDENINLCLKEVGRDD
jgi:hypothetical protein